MGEPQRVRPVPRKSGVDFSRLKIPEYLDLNTWRLVSHGMGRLIEIETEWTLEDVHDAHLVLDIREDIQVLQDLQRP